MAVTDPAVFAEAPAGLAEILTYRRCADSLGERVMTRLFIKPTGAKQDEYGNWILRIGAAPILWSSHTDTVHGAREAMTQVLTVESGLLYSVNGLCLGADCGTGVWLMLEMVKAGVEGLYIWHAAEERGRVGSGQIIMHTPEILDGIQAAIAFDRRGFDSIVTHQMGGRTCSDEFAVSLSSALGIYMEPDDSGMYTDTLEYEALIPECTNISVGYYSQHTKNESQSLNFARRLHDALLEIDTTKLVIERDPTERPLYSYSRNDWGWDDEMVVEGTGSVYSRCEWCKKFRECHAQARKHDLFVCEECWEDILREGGGEEHAKPYKVCDYCEGLSDAVEEGMCVTCRQNCDTGYFSTL